MVVCKNCGTEIVDDALFCQNCGTKLENVEKEHKFHKKPRNKKKTENKILEILPDCAKVLNADIESCYPTSLFKTHDELQFKGSKHKSLTKHAIVMNIVEEKFSYIIIGKFSHNSQLKI